MMEAMILVWSDAVCVVRPGNDGGMVIPVSEKRAQEWAARWGFDFSNPRPVRVGRGVR